MQRRSILMLGPLVLATPFPALAARPDERFDVVVVGAGGAGLAADRDAWRDSAAGWLREMEDEPAA